MGTDDGSDDEGAARAERILDSAAALAREGGFEAVRIRDVAARANVALGTLYKRFSGKDEILLAVLDREFERLERSRVTFGTRGRTYVERALGFFEPVTAFLCAQERFTGAVLRAVLSGEAGLAAQVGRFHARVTALIADALGAGGAGPPADEARALDADAVSQLAYILAQIWFAALVGWMGGLLTPAELVERVRSAAALLVRGLQTAA